MNFFFGLTWAVARAGAIDLILTASRWECCLRFVGGWCRLTIQKWLMHQMFHIRLLYIKMRNWHCRVLKKNRNIVSEWADCETKWWGFYGQKSGSSCCNSANTDLSFLFFSFWINKLMLCYFMKSLGALDLYMCGINDQSSGSCRFEVFKAHCWGDRWSVD